MDEEYYGVIKLFAGNFVPRGYMPCDGRLISIMENQALFAIIGTTYGGDGRTNFGLPKMESAVGHYIICTQGIFPTRD